MSHVVLQMSCLLVKKCNRDRCHDSCVMTSCDRNASNDLTFMQTPKSQIKGGNTLESNG